MGEIVVFSKSNCHHCHDAKSLLNELDIPFTDIDIEADVQNSMLMSLASQRHTVPQIFFNSDHIGGAEDLLRLEPENIIIKAQKASDMSILFCTSASISISVNGISSSFKRDFAS